MNVIVCAKQLQATYARTGKVPETHYLNPEDSIFRINPYDDAAMALAVGIKASLSNTRITVVTLAPMTADEDLWRLMGMGGDRLCRIDLASGDPASLDAWAKAQVLARAVRAIGADLVLCGKESLDRGNGLVAAYMAHYLRLPHVTGIQQLQIHDDGGARVTLNAGKGRREIMDCRMPTLFSVDLLPVPVPRPSFTAIQQARGKEVLHMVEDAGSLTSKTICTATTAPRPRPKPIVAPDSRLPGHDRVKQLLAGSTIQKKGKLVSGSPEQQVDEIVSFLTQHGFISPGPPES
jgi:electron transfer flavoprotein beta subunit